VSRLDDRCGGINPSWIKLYAFETACCCRTTGGGVKALTRALYGQEVEPLAQLERSHDFHAAAPSRVTQAEQGVIIFERLAADVLGHHYRNHPSIVVTPTVRTNRNREPTIPHPMRAIRSRKCVMRGAARGRPMKMFLIHLGTCRRRIHSRLARTD